MKILFIIDTRYCFQNGIWFHRNHLPSKGLKSRGHDVQFMVIGGKVPDKLLDMPDTVIFGRTYHPSLKPLELLREFKSRGKRILYDLDDDFWAVNPDNPSVLVSNAFKDQYEGFVRECDAVITPSKVLAKKMRKLAKKDVFICHNSINYDYYHKRPNEHLNHLIIGYSGAASHWRDLDIITKPLIALSKKHEFTFTLQGLAGAPLEAEMYIYDQVLRRELEPEKNEYYKNALDWYSKTKELKMFHVPFYPPELHPNVMSRCDFDIALAPLEDNEFNRSKSCIKYYEYASVGSAVLASDVSPYKDEVNYLAKNTFQDWYDKLEKLIMDKKFREKLAKKQYDWVKKNRSKDVVALDWEMACQRKGGLKVLNQKKK